MSIDRMNRRQFIKSISLLLPSALQIRGEERRGRDLGDLGLHIPFPRVSNLEFIEPFKRQILGCGANTVVVDIKNEYGLTHIPFDYKYKPRTSFSVESPERLAKFLNWAEVKGIRVIGRMCIMPDQKLLTAYPGFGYKRKDGSLWFGGQGPWVNPFRQEAAHYNAAIAEAAIDFGINEINVDYIRFPSGEDPIGQIEYSQANNFLNRTTALRDYLEIIHESVKKKGGFLSADFFGGTAWPQSSDMGIGQHIETQGKFVDGLYPMAYPGLSATKWRGIPEWCEVGTDCPYEFVYLATKLTKERLQRVNPSGLVRTWYQAYPDRRFGREMTLKEFELQQLAAFNAGAEGVLAWDTSMVYHQHLYTRINFVRMFARLISE
jgi:hypothetical protein